MRRHQLFAKVSRPEVAAALPVAGARRRCCDALVARASSPRDEAELAARVPVAEDVTVEADSGGHTDNRPLVALLPTIARAARRARRSSTATSGRSGSAPPAGSAPRPRWRGVRARRGVRADRLGQPGWPSSPGCPTTARRCWPQADLADVIMAPAADMFEMGVKVQVLKRGTMFAVRAGRAVRAYRDHASLEAIPAATLRARSRRDVLRATVDEVWAETRRVLAAARPGAARPGRARPEAPDGAGLPLVPGPVEPLGDRRRAGAADRLPGLVRPGDGRVQRTGRAARFLAEPGERTVVQIALNLLEGAAVITRAHQLRTLRRRRCPPAGVRTSSRAAADLTE